MALSQNDLQDAHRTQLNRAVQYASQGREDKSYEIFATVLKEDFDNLGAIYGLARLYMMSENYGLAYNLYRICASSEKMGAGPWNGMGLCHAESWDLQAAENLFKKALSCDKNDKHALGNLSLISLLKCDPEKSLRYADLALKIDPDFEEVIHHQTYAYLMLGRWKEGWEGHKRILGKVKTRAERGYENHGIMIPKWEGKPNQTVLVYAEQGIGDEISFASCLPDIERISKKVVFDCDHRLESLFKESFPNIDIRGTRFKDPTEWVDDYQFDGAIAIGDLPGFFRNHESDFPGTPYLKTSLISLDGLNIGIAWTGGIPATGTKRRSMTLEDILPILKAVPANWVSLEYKDRSKEIAEFTAKHGIRIEERPEPRSQNYEDAAKLVQGLDLVITVTTAVVHLSGALGKEAWVLVPESPRWFYGIEGDRSPWYKSVQYFRQKDGWREPIQQIAKLLKLRYS